MIKLGTRFWDERNGRYLTVNGQGIDPQVYSCIQEEITEDGDDFEVTDVVLMKEGELLKMEKR